MTMMTGNGPHCALCHKNKKCKFDDGICLADCPTKNYPDFAEQSIAYYAEQKEDVFFLQSLRQVACGYEVDEKKNPRPTKSRVQELIEFSHRMGYRKIGVAFCTALEDDAKKLVQILQKEQFEVVSVICKVGGIRKETIGLTEDEKIVPGRREISCNPYEQALICNKAHTDFNVVFGLCLGHDSIFLRESNALCTVLVVKDRVYKHNPIKGIREHL